MTLKQLLEGKKARVVGDGCILGEKDKIIILGETNIDHWYCLELISPISYKPKPHKHVLTCKECGEEVKK